jgi:hypothetical protein
MSNVEATAAVAGCAIVVAAIIIRLAIAIQDWWHKRQSDRRWP